MPWCHQIGRRKQPMGRLAGNKTRNRWGAGWVVSWSLPIAFRRPDPDTSSTPSGLRPNCVKSFGTMARWRGRLAGHKTGKKRLLPGSNPGTACGFSVKRPSIEQEGPFFFPARRPPGGIGPPKAHRYEAGGRRWDCPRRRKLPPESCRRTRLSGGYPGGSPPGHALWVLSLV